MKKDSMEIKTLLENVKDLLSSTLKKNKTDTLLKISSNDSESRSISKTRLDFSEPQMRSNSEKLNDYLSQHSDSFERTSSSFPSFEKIKPVNSTPKSKGEKEADISSLYSIDYTSDVESIHDSLFEITKAESLSKQNSG